MSRPPSKQENPILNLAFNIAIPALIMGQLSGARWLGPKWGLVVALLFPLGYGVWDFVVRKKANFISGLGFTGVLLSGVFGLMKLDGFWFAVKDAAIPALIGTALLASMGLREPLVKTLFFNDAIMDVPRVEEALRAHGAEAAFATLLRRCTVLLALAFFASGAIGFGLARYLLTSPGGTPEFNAQLSKMHWLSVPVIMLPFMAMMLVAMWRLIGGITKLTGLTMDDMFRTAPEKK